MLLSALLVSQVPSRILAESSLNRPGDSVLILDWYGPLSTYQSCGRCPDVRNLAWDPNHLVEGAKGPNAMGSLQATRYKKNGTGKNSFFRQARQNANWLEKLLPEATRIQNFTQNLCLPKAIPFTILPLFLVLDFSVTINHLRIMLSTISNYFSVLKKKHYDDLTDYDKGKLHGIISAHAVLFAWGMTFELYGAYKGMR